MSGDQTGPLLVLAGIALAILGLVIWTGALDWFGRLPGDSRYATLRLSGTPARPYLLPTLAPSCASILNGHSIIHHFLETPQ